MKLKNIKKSILLLVALFLITTGVSYAETFTLPSSDTNTNIFDTNVLSLQDNLQLNDYKVALNTQDSSMSPADLNTSKEWMLSGSLRSRYEWWDWFNPGKVAGGMNYNYPYVGNLARIKLTNERPHADTTVEFSVPALFFLPHNASAPPPQGPLGLGGIYKGVNRGNFTSIFLKQANINFKGTLEKNTNVKLGRFEFFDGLESLTGDTSLDWVKKNRIGQRLIGNFGFTHIQRSFDGFHISHDDPYTNITIVGAKPTYGVFDLSGNREVSDVDFLYTSITPKFNFVRAGLKPIEKRNYDARLFYLLYNDDRSLLKSDNRPLTALRRDTQDILLNTFGGHYLQKVGPVDLLTWGTLQFGDWGKQKQRAFAYTYEAGYQPKNFFMKPWLRIGRERSSGDSNSTDGKHETFFQMLPTPRLYAKTPFFNMMNLKNNFIQLLFRPRDKMAVTLEFHNLRLAEPKDLWYIGGGAFQNSTFGFNGRPSSGKRALANLLDIGFDYKVSKNLDFSFYLGHIIGDGVVRSIYPGRRGNFTYWELTRYF